MKYNVGAGTERLVAVKGQQRAKNRIGEEGRKGARGSKGMVKRKGKAEEEEE